MNRILILLISTWTLISCTRPQLEKSKLTIAFPDGIIHSASVADSTLSHIVVNVTIPGQPSLYYSWDMMDQLNKTGSATPPADVNFELTSGSGRMIQVLYVFNNNTTLVYDYQYGDKTVNITGTQVIVEVPLTNIATAPNALGRITGRYFTSATSGPTGNVDIRFTPPGKPAMTIESEYMYGGWFSFFALSDISLDYVLTSGPDAGKKIFNQSVSLQADYFKNPNNLTYPQNILKGGVPLSYDSSLTNINEAKVFLWGWFSDKSAGAESAISTKKVCPQITDGEATNFFRYDNHTNLTFHNTNNNNSFPTTAELISTTTSWNVIEYFGGASVCSPGEVELEGKISIYPDSFTDTMSAKNLPFVGPLKLLPIDAGGDDLIIDGVTDTSKKRAQLIPGMNGVIQNIYFYVYTSANNNFDTISNSMTGTFPCENVPTYDGRLIISNPSETPFEFSTNDIDTVMSSAGDKLIGMCFKNSAGQNIGPGLLYWPSNVGGGSNNPYLRFEISGGSQSQAGNITNYNLTTGNCYPVTPTLYKMNQSSGNSDPWAIPNGETITISGSSLLSSGIIYKDPCTTMVAVADNFILDSAGNFTDMFYMKSSTDQSNIALSLTLSKSAGITDTIDAAVNDYQKFNFTTPTACGAGSTPGDTCPGGAIYLGTLNPGATSGGAVTDYYMTTPGGCGDIPVGQVDGGSGQNSYTNSTFTPTCSGSDTVYKTWNDGTTNYYDIPDISNFTGAVDVEYGSDSTALISAITANGEGGYHAAARYCDQLSIGGYSDWHLPNYNEILLFDSQIPGFDTTSWYWTSAESDTTYTKVRRSGDSAVANANKDYANKVRCIRRF